MSHELVPTSVHSGARTRRYPGTLNTPEPDSHPQSPIRRPRAPRRDAASSEKAAVHGPGRSVPGPAGWGRRYQTQPTANLTGPTQAALSLYRSCLQRTQQLTKPQTHEDTQRLPCPPSSHKAHTTQLSPSEVAGAQLLTLKVEN